MLAMSTWLGSPTGAPATGPAAPAMGAVGAAALPSSPPRVRSTTSRATAATPPIPAITQGSGLPGLERRSASSACVAAVGAPHWLQKRPPGGNWLPHSAQVTAASRLAPQLEQKRPEDSCPQAGHFL